MPEPDADANLPAVKRAALYALGAGTVIAVLKFIIFGITNSVAVLSDALESLINIAAAGAMLYTIWYSNKPADREHPYGHGKIEFMTVGLEGWLILLAGLVIAYEAISRLLFIDVTLNLNVGIWLLGGVGILDTALAVYVWRAGRKYANQVLKADGKHLFTDVASTAGVLVGLVLVQWTGYTWLDPLVAIVMASLILFASWRLLWQSFHGLMDHADPDDERAIHAVLDDEVTRGHIHGYHKVRHRHTGPFHWVDMHLHVDPDMSITQGHELASRIEGRIEQTLGRANATAHLEPYDPQRHPPAGLSAADREADQAPQRQSDDAAHAPHADTERAPDQHDTPASSSTDTATDEHAEAETDAAPERADVREPDADNSPHPTGDASPDASSDSSPDASPHTPDEYRDGDPRA